MVRPIKKNRRKKPTIDDQAEIDAVATALIKGWFAQGWLLRDRLPRDIFIDYEIERVAAGEPSGLTFYAQQKGHRNVKFTTGSASQRFDTKDLTYYAQKQDRPVFLLMVDVTARTAYFLFLQEWIDRHTTPGALDRQDTLTVKVPITNRIGDGPALEDAVSRAVSYMREKYPGSVGAAIRADVSKVVARDPRFDVRLDLVDSQKQYHLTPKVPVDVRLHISGEKVGHFRELFEYGRPLDITGDGVAIEGLPIIGLPDPSALARLVFKPANARECDFEFWLDGPREECRVRFDGEITGGTAGLLYRGRVKDAPLRVEMKINPNLMKESGQATLNVTWDFSAWDSRCILDLPYFDALAVLASATTSGRQIFHRFSFQGRRLTQGTLGSPKDLMPFAYADAALSLIREARELARTFNVRPQLPKLNDVTEAAENAIHFAHAVAIAGGHRIKREGLGLECHVNVARGSALPSGDQPAGEFKAIDSRHDACVFGTPIDIGPVEISLAPAKMVVPDESRAKVAAGTTENIPIEIVGIGEATFTIRRLNPAEFQDATNRS